MAGAAEGASALVRVTGKRDVNYVDVSDLVARSPRLTPDWLTDRIPAAWLTALAIGGAESGGRVLDSPLVDP